jgi:tetratricopeptide (TPR) repeat protein
MTPLCRTLAIAPLALALMLPTASRPQATAFPIAADASILVGPLLLLVIPLALHLTRSDEKRVREFEALEDWPGLAAFATRRIQQHPADPHWLELRGRALQRQGRCKDALPDLAFAFESQLAAQGPAKAAYAAGLALGMCQMALPDLVAAAATFERLHQLDPSQPEPAYNLGVIRTIQGDTAAAATALATLTSRNVGLGESLRAYMAAAAAQPSAATPGSGADRPSIAQGRLDIGERTLQLPGGDWYLASRSQSSVRGGMMRAASARTQVVSVVSLQAFALAPDGSFVAAAEFSANPQQAHGVGYWNADDGCAVRNVLHLKRFRADFDQPECVYLRMIAPAAEARWQPLLQEWGGPPPGLAYEVHYERYGTGWLVASTFLLPVTQVTGDFAATQWAHALAAQLRPLARTNHPAAALVPPLVKPASGR